MDKMIKKKMVINVNYSRVMIICFIIYHVCINVIVRPFFLYSDWLKNLSVRPLALGKKKNNNIYTCATKFSNVWFYLVNYVLYCTSATSHS